MDFVKPQTKIQEKQVLIDNLNINYKIIGDGNIPIILLHGWGLNSDKYSVLAEYLSEVKSEKLKVKSYCIYLLDLPGFGKSDNPPEPWGVDEYVELVKKFIEMSLESALKQGIAALPSEARNDKIVLIGHSFGGRIAIKFSARYPEKLKALVLTAAAGIKHPPTIKQKIFYALAKVGKIIFSLPLIDKLEKSAQKLLYKAAREKDYYEAQGIMRETFKKVIDEDLTPCLEKISAFGGSAEGGKIPTLLVWGAKDNSTPLADFKIMESRIKNQESRIISEANHSLPYQIPEKFAKIVMEFIKKSG